MHTFSKLRRAVSRPYAVAERYLTTDSSCDCHVCKTMIHDEFRESEHPRGQPENAGEFSSTGVKVAKKQAGTAQSHLVQSLGVGKNRTTLTGEPLPDHIRALVIPPAWTDLKYSADPNADLLAVGRDAKGRGQYRYAKKYSGGTTDLKFQRIKVLDSIFSKVVAQNEQDRKTKNVALRDTADCAWLIMQMGVRPGSESDSKSKVQAYGATTLLGRHVIRDKLGLVSLQFIGKDGVSLNLPVSNPEMAKMLLNRSKTAGPSGQLFATTDEDRLGKYVSNIASSGGAFYTKDFRTLLGTKTAISTVGMMPVPKTEKEYKASVLEVAKRVSKVLGNTPVICLQAYISPVVFADWKMATSGGLAAA